MKKLLVVAALVFLFSVSYGKSEEATWGIVDTGYASIDARSIDDWMWPKRKSEDILWDALHWHWEWSPAWIYRHPKWFFLVISGLMLWLLFMAVRCVKDKLSNKR